MNHYRVICPHMTIDNGRADNSIGGLALVAIGNSLIEKDRAGLSFLCAAQGADICRIPLGVYTIMIADILKSHRAAIILDALDMPESISGHMKIKLEKSVIMKVSLPLIFSHGISFMDELRFYFNNTDVDKDLYFFGVASDLTDQHKRAHAMDELETLIASLSRFENPSESKGAYHA